MHETEDQANDDYRSNEKAIAPDIYSLQLQYLRRFYEGYSVRPHWHRTFEVSKDTTLESLNGIILDILDWDPSHLYEFKIRDTNYVHFGDDEYFVLETSGDCISCDVPLSVLHLVKGDSFRYIFDFGDQHTFEITVTATRMLNGSARLPALISHKGQNLLQYPGFLSPTEEHRFQKKPKHKRRTSATS